MDWTQAILEIGKVTGGGIIASAITLVVSSHRQSKDLERDARHLANRLVYLYETFALDCADVPQKNAEVFRDDPYDSSGTVGLPELPDLPEDDAGWRAIEQAIAIDARMFPQKLNHAHGVISADAEHGDADDVEATINRQAVLLGTQARELSSRIRHRYKLGVSNPPWDVDTFLAEKAALFAEQDVKAAEENRRFWIELEAETKVPKET